MSAHEQEKESAEVLLKGIGVSPGVVVGPVRLLAERGLHVPERNIAPNQVGAEIARFEQALIDTRAQIREIQKNLEDRDAGKDAGILDAHLMVLDDRTFIEQVVSRISENLINAEAVVKQAADHYAGLLASLEDDYLRERVADIHDVGRRIISNLLGADRPVLDGEQERHILVAVDLAPSDTANLSKDNVMAFATDMGSGTSHTAVMARALELPAVVALHDLTSRVHDEQELLIDGNKGVVILNPTAQRLEEYGKVTEARETIVRELNTLRDVPAETLDGHRIVLAANIEQASEARTVLDHGAEGVGLFRSEYLLLSKGAIIPEEEQVVIYSEVARALAPAPVVIRTMDLGGDKFFAAPELANEQNPFLGCRSIRLSLRHPGYFKTQLRAILRAGTAGTIKIMYPMISSLDEILQANRILDLAKQELYAEKVAFDDSIKAGIMVEIPSAALMADQLAPHVAFFSIGTNDLVQYTIAVDRVNDHVAYLYEPTHPAVLRLIEMTVKASRKHAILTSICGEMGADPVLAPLLVGLGVDGLSVAPVAVPLVKDVVRKIRRTDAEALAKRALACASAKEVLQHCREMITQTAPEILELIE